MEENKINFLDIIIMKRVNWNQNLPKTKHWGSILNEK